MRSHANGTTTTRKAKLLARPNKNTSLLPISDERNRVIRKSSFSSYSKISQLCFFRNSTLQLFIDMGGNLAKTTRNKKFIFYIRHRAFREIVNNCNAQYELIVATRFVQFMLTAPSICSVSNNCT